MPRCLAGQCGIRGYGSALKAIPPQRLWLNPDCGLKTRTTDEVGASLRDLVAAASQIRGENSIE